MPKLLLCGLAGSVAWALLSAPLVQAATDPDDGAAIEELLVTGSFIRRHDGFDAASPVQVLDLEELARGGPRHLGELLREQPFNYGVDTVANLVGSTTTYGKFSQANLRGLGASATLTLMDGRRTATRNLQNLYPGVVLSRVETLTDGGSALYGTDAVAGVVNVVPLREFHGLDLQVAHGGDTQGDYTDTTWSLLSGLGNDSSNLVMAVEYRDREALSFRDRPDLLRAMISSSGDGSPGNWLVPQRDPLTGAPLTDDGGSVLRQSVADPGCGLNNTGPDDKTGQLNQRTGFLAFDTCRMEFGEFFDYLPDQRALQAVALLEHAFNDHLTFQGELLYAEQDASNRGSPSNPGGQLSQLGTVPGEHPGNPYRATADGRPLFAQDANGDGIADRDPAGQVVLAADPFDASAGIAFNEDVLAATWRPYGKYLTQPSRSNSDGSGVADATEERNWRWAGRLDYRIADSSWSTWLDYTYHENQLRAVDVQVESLSALQQGVRGELVVDGETRWFNPFSTQDFACVDGDCSGGVAQTDAAARNSVAVLDRVLQEERDEITTTLNVLDWVATGDVVELPAGMLSAAIGGQWRHTETDADLGALSNSGDAWISVRRLDWKEDRRVLAAFAELRVPLLDSRRLGELELNAAVRTENYDDDSVRQLESTDYKLALRWQPRPYVALRASAGTAFVAPELDALFEPASFDLSEMSDPLFDRPSTFKARAEGGNPELAPEQAEIYNVGATLELLDGDLSLAVDWMRFDFDDRIARPLPQDVLDRDYQRFLAASAADPSLTAARWAREFEDPRIRRNPDTLVIEQVETPLVNAAEMRWQGLDLRADYRFETTRYGSFGASLLATYVDEYSFRESALGPRRQAAGRRNNETGFVPPVPRWRGNAQLSWALGRHGASVTGRYTHHVTEDDGLCALPAVVLEGLDATPDGCPARIPSKMIWDAQYTLTLDGLVGERRTSLQIGAINVFDTYPPALASLGGMEVFLHDPRGAQWYLRFRQQL